MSKEKWQRIISIWKNPHGFFETVEIHEKYNKITKLVCFKTKEKLIEVLTKIDFKYIAIDKKQKFLHEELKGFNLTEVTTIDYEIDYNKYTHHNVFCLHNYLEYTYKKIIPKCIMFSLILNDNCFPNFEKCSITKEIKKTFKEPTYTIKES